mgnify:CR=1 FL=1
MSSKHLKIYTAARFSDRARLRAARDRMFQMGHECTASWLDEVAKPETMTIEVFNKKLAIKDFTEISAADIIVVDTLEPLITVAETSSGGGREVELGFALGQWHRKEVWRVGPARNVFHQLVDRAFADWDECLEALDG